MHGTGLNSIRWRFALASAVLTVTGVLARDLALGAGRAFGAVEALSLAVVVVAVSAITFWMATRLTDPSDATRPK